jgi:hypothetical protein
MHFKNNSFYGFVLIATFPPGDNPVTVYNIIEGICGQVTLIDLFKVII